MSEFTKTNTYEEIKRFFEGNDDFEVRMYIQYIDGILTKVKPNDNDHAKYCKSRLIEIANHLSSNTTAHHNIDKAQKE